MNTKSISRKTATSSRSEVQTKMYEVEVVYKGPLTSELPKITSSISACQTFRQFIDDRKLDYKEMFYVMLLNKGNFCIALSTIGIGCTNSVNVNVKEILQLALKTNASGVILMHNHPSGNTKPSEADERITRRIKGAADLFDVQLIDHLILTREEYHSFADNGAI